MAEVCGVLAEEGLIAASISIDDFYLTRTEQIALAREYARNPYLKQRGYPGTHDVSLGVSVLKALRMLSDGQSMKVPGYDRSAYQGLGDRTPESDWRVVTASVAFDRPGGVDAWLHPHRREIAERQGSSGG